MPDLDLWAAVIREVKPLKGRTRKSERAPHAPSMPPPAEKPATQAPPQPVARVRPPAKRPAQPPPLTGLDRRTQRRLMRGDVEIEARLDLHGETQATARTRLLAFLQAERRRGSRTVLVITGKGDAPFAGHTLHGARHYHAPERTGRLRRLATEWLNEAEFRAHVSAFQPAHPKHGGGGAFYVRLRRPAAAA